MLFLVVFTANSVTNVRDNFAGIISACFVELLNRLHVLWFGFHHGIGFVDGNLACYEAGLSSINCCQSLPHVLASYAAFANCF